MTRYRAVAGAAIGVAGIGFGVMGAFWAAADKDTGLRGFTSYLSATWGDALCLPVLASGAVHIVGSLPSVGGERRAAAVAGVAGLLLGGASQVVWLRDPSPELNWTLPTPGHFNMAGLYHAGFLTALSGAAAATATVALLRWAAAPPETVTRSVKVAAVLCATAATSFLVLLTIDNKAIAGTRASIGTAAAVVGGIGLLGVVARSIRRRRR